MERLARLRIVKTGMNAGKFARFLLGLFAFLTLFSCTTRIGGPLNADGSAVMSVSVSLEPKMTALIQKLFTAGGVSLAGGGSAAGISILDGPAISASMSNAPGIASVLLKNTAPAAIEGPVRISKISDFLTYGAGGGFITFEQGRSGGRCKININRENGPEILPLLSPEIVDYLSAIMAPIATGEDLGKAEYLAIVSSVYNKAISDEISGSKIRASIDFPGVIYGIKGGTFTGKRAEFDIPLIDLLVLETPLIYEVEWKQ